MCCVTVNNGFLKKLNLIKLSNVDSSCVLDDPGFVLEGVVNTVDGPRKVSVTH